MSENWIAGLDLNTRSGPRYRALASAIDQAIENGDLPSQIKMPPQRDLAFDLGITVGTVGRAYDLLTRQGKLRGEVGRGTYVCGNGDEKSMPIQVPEDAAGQIDLTVNMPIWTPAMDRMAEVIAEITASPAGMALTAGYPPTLGLRKARMAASSWLARQGVLGSAGQVLLTGGAQAGIAATLAALVRPGEGVLLETLTFTRFGTLARSLGMRPEPVAMDNKGIIPESLEAACRQGRGRVLVTSPALNNPTGAQLSEERRYRIAEMAARHDLMIIEDDVYGVTIPDTPPKLHVLAPDRTVFVTSLSKFIAPGLRCGMVLAPAGLVNAIASKQADFAIAVPALGGLALAGAEAIGLLDEAAKQQQEAISKRQANVRPYLPNLAIESPPVCLHLWVGLGDEHKTSQTMLALSQQGIRVAGGRAFAADPRAQVPYLRISLGPLRDAQLASCLPLIDAAFTGSATADMII